MSETKRVAEQGAEQGDPGRSTNVERRPGRGFWRYGALTLLAGVFATSAILRTGEVVAGLPDSVTDGFGNPLARSESDAAAGASMTIPETNSLISELRRQKTEMAERHAKLEAREILLRATERRIADRMTEIEAARERLAATAALVDNAAARDVEHLAEMYQSMKPKQAGQIFNQMAPAFASGFLAEMRSDTAALILANMDASKAYAITLLMAGRNVDSSERR